MCYWSCRNYIFWQCPGSERLAYTCFFGKALAIGSCGEVFSIFAPPDSDDISAARSQSRSPASLIWNPLATPQPGSDLAVNIYYVVTQTRVAPLGEEDGLSPCTASMPQTTYIEAQVSWLFIVLPWYMMTEEALESNNPVSFFAHIPSFKYKDSNHFCTSFRPWNIFSSHHEQRPTQTPTSIFL
jgi:hypothetical protein